MFLKHSNHIQCLRACTPILIYVSGHGVITLVLPMGKLFQIFSDICVNAFLSSFLQTPTKYSLALLEVSEIQKISPVDLYLPSWVTFPFKRSLCLFPLESYSFPHFTVVNFLPAQWAGEKAGLNTCFRHGSHVFLDIFLKKMVVNRYGKVR